MADNFKKYFYLIVFIIIIPLLLTQCDKSFQPPVTTGKGGSMARFTIVNEHLYVVDDRNLKVFDVTQADVPVFINELNVGFSIETIFSFNNKLFIGSNNGMYIYDITTPSNPQYITEVTHIISCDPVVVNDSMAFITLRSGGDCRTSVNVNQLEIIDISNINNPFTRAVHPMETPFGLGIDSNLIFICHGDSGFGIYDFSAIDSLKTIHTIPDIKTFDVIPHNKTLLIIGESGFYQYSYSNIDSIYLLSHIASE